MEIKLLGIAKGSNQELLEDYQDYLKHNGLAEWAKAGKSGISGISGQTGSSGYASRFNRLHAYCKEHSDLPAYEPFFSRWTDEEMANTAICLCHMVDKMMCSFIEKCDHEFTEEGGIRERMTAARLDRRGTQKQIIAQLEAENAALKAQVTSLQRELAVCRPAKPDKPANPDNPE